MSKVESIISKMMTEVWEPKYATEQPGGNDRYRDKAAESKPGGGWTAMTRATKRIDGRLHARTFMGSVKEVETYLGPTWFVTSM